MPFKFKLSRRLARLRIAVLVTSFLPLACVTGDKLLVDPQVPQAQIVRLVLTPSDVTVQSGKSVDFSAVGLTASGDTAPVSLTWFAKRGQVTDDPDSRPGKRKGHYKSPNGIRGRDTVVVTDTSGVADTSTVTITDTAVATVVVQPSSVTLEVGSSQLLRAISYDSSGNELSGRAVTWQSSATSVATVSDNGRITGQAAGAATITATVEDQSATASVTVTQAPVASVTVTPAEVSVEEGQTVLLSAVAHDADGNPLSGRSFTWSTSDPVVATVNENGRVSGVAEGSAVITATSEGQRGTASVTVTAPPPPPPPGSSLPVFPGAIGFGATTPAGRGGTVYRVTNLNAGGSGSLGAALAASGPRVVIFEVSGTIVLSDHLEINDPYVTVAGQTAPSPGITLRGAGLRIDTHDVLVQHIRIRVGDDPSGPNPDGRDALQVYGSNVYNVVVDHVSLSWGIDENASSSTSGTRHDITISHSIIGEGLNNSLHSEGPHSKGLLLGEGTGNFAVIGSLFLHNYDRNPYQKGDTRVLFANNVVYNWGGSKAHSIGGNGASGPSLASIVGNVFLRGTDTESGSPVKIYDSVNPGSGVYVADNSQDRQVPSDQWSLVTNEVGNEVRLSSPAVWASLMHVRPVSQVEAYVLANAGARPADRDAVDGRLVDEVRNGTGRIIDSPSQVGGWPTLAQNVRSLTLPASPNGDDDGDGYTNLEEWLHQLAAQVEGR